MDLTYTVEDAMVIAYTPVKTYSPLDLYSFPQNHVPFYTAEYTCAESQFSHFMSSVSFIN